MIAYFSYLGSEPSDRKHDVTCGIRGALLVVLVSATLAIGLAGCGSSGSGSVNVMPVITSGGLSPSSGTVGTAVTITGTSFGATQVSNSSVTFNGTAAPVISWSDTSIVADVPSSATTGNVIVTAAGVASSGSAFTVTAGATSACAASGALHGESLLNGTYVYTVSGFQGGSPGNHFGRVGSFIATGGGNITGGEEDLNVSTGNVHHTVVTASSSYSVGVDGRGCANLSFSDASTVTFRFSLGTLSAATPPVAGRGHIIEFDDASGAGKRGSGIILQATTSAFSAGTLAALQANYSFGLDGVNATGGHVAEGGTFTLTPATGAIAAGTFDFNNAGTAVFPFTTGTAGLSTGTIATGVTAATGRTTATFIGTPACAATTCTYHWVIYVVNANQLFVMSTDALGVNTPIVSGRAIATTTGFTAGSLNSPSGYIFEGMGITGGLASADLEQLTFTAGTLNVAGTQWTYTNPTAAKVTLPASTPFVVSAVGRFTFGNKVLYLTNPAVGNTIAAFVVGTDTAATGGLMVAQGATTLSATGNGRFFFGTVFMADNNVQNTAGVAGLLSASGGTSDTVTGAFDQSSSASPFLSSATFPNTLFTVGTAGAVTATDSGAKAIVGVADGNALFFIDENGDAAITVVEQ
jgi:IPT/TIG domain